MTTPAAPDLAAAWTALKTYDYGSSRGTLLPIDQAVAEAVRDRPARRPLERQLLACLTAGGSVPAREYICACLALVGSDYCVSAMAKLLGDPALSTAARNVLEVLPTTSAGKALRRSIPRLEDGLKIGVINSLGNRREPTGVSALAALLKDRDSDVVCAAISALGVIGDPKAAKALAGFFAGSRGTLRAAAADAMLVCGGTLARAGKTSEAGTLCQTLIAAQGLPERFPAAASRLLRTNS